MDNTNPQVQQFAQLILDAFEREFWAGHNHHPRLVSAPLNAVFQLLPATVPEPRSPPSGADPEHERLYGEAIAAWNALAHSRSLLEALVDHFRSIEP